MKLVFLALALALCPPLALATDKPVVYTSAAGGDTPLDRAFKKIYADKYIIEDISAAAGYLPPKPAAGGLPRSARNEAGEQLEGKVLIAYIITEKGQVSDPVILSSSNEELNPIALQAMKGWRFVPGTRKGVPIPTTAAQEFDFRIERAGFETTNMVLYQPDDVLKQRLPGAGHLAAYVEKLQSAVTELLSKSTTPDTLVIVTAVRPGKASRVWLMGSALDATTQAAIRQKLEAIPAVEVKDGPVAFAICGTIAGGAEFSETPPLPQEWKEAAEKLPPPVLLPDAVLDTVWPSQ